MQIKGSSALSTFAVPVLGLGALLLGLWHTGPAAPPRPEAAAGVYLIDPDPRLDESLTVYLRQEAKEVALCRERLHSNQSADGRLPQAEARWRYEGLRRAVDGYNLIARECTPAVFQKTGMPPALTP